MKWFVLLVAFILCFQLLSPLTRASDGMYASEAKGFVLGKELVLVETDDQEMKTGTSFEVFDHKDEGLPYLSFNSKDRKHRLTLTYNDKVDAGPGSIEFYSNKRLYRFRIV